MRAQARGSSGTLLPPLQAATREAQQACTRTLARTHKHTHMSSIVWRAAHKRRSRTPKDSTLALLLKTEATPSSTHAPQRQRQPEPLAAAAHDDSGKASAGVRANGRRPCGKCEAGEKNLQNSSTTRCASHPLPTSRTLAATRTPMFTLSNSSRRAGASTAQRVRLRCRSRAQQPI